MIKGQVEDVENTLKRVIRFDTNWNKLGENWTSAAVGWHKWTNNFRPTKKRKRCSTGKSTLQR